MKNLTKLTVQEKQTINGGASFWEKVCKWLKDHFVTSKDYVYTYENMCSANYDGTNFAGIGWNLP